MNRLKRGQGLVEFALVLPILLLVLVASTDIFMVAANVLIGEHLSARAARGAALSSTPDGVTSCTTRVAGLLSGDYFIMADWDYSTTNCPSNPLSGIARGAPVSVLLTLYHHPTFLPGDPWIIELEAVDYGR